MKKKLLETIETISNTDPDELTKRMKKAKGPLGYEDAYNLSRKNLITATEIIDMAILYAVSKTCDTKEILDLAKEETGYRMADITWGFWRLMDDARIKFDEDRNVVLGDT